MSEEVYFNHYTLRGKMEYFFKNMSNIVKVDGKPVWSDVFMFYGSSYQSNGYVHYRQGWMNDFENNFEQFDSESNQKTCVSRLHVPIYYPLSDMWQRKVSHPIVEMFKSRYFICMVNTHLFSSLRGIKIAEDNRIPNSWDEGFATIPDIKWFDGPLTEVDNITNSTTVSGFLKLSKEVQENIKKHHNSNLDQLFNLTELYKTDNVAFFGPGEALYTEIMYFEPINSKEEGKYTYKMQLASFKKKDSQSIEKFNIDFFMSLNNA